MRFRNDEGRRPAAWGATSFFRNQPPEQPRRHFHHQEEARPASYPAAAVMQLHLLAAGEKTVPTKQPGYSGKAAAILPLTESLCDAMPQTAWLAAHPVEFLEVRGAD